MGGTLFVARAQDQFLLALIHPSAWKGDSRREVYRLLPTPRPYSPSCLEEEFSEVRLSADAVVSVLLAPWEAYLLLHPPRCILGVRLRSHNPKGEWSSDDDGGLWRSGGLWGLHRRGSWIDAGATFGASDDPQGAQRRSRLHLRRPGRHLRRVAGARGHRRVGGIRACPRHGGERGQRAGRDLLARPSAPRTRGAPPSGTRPILR